MQDEEQFLDTKENELNTNNDDIVSMKAFKELAKKVDQMEKQINDLEEENKKLKQNQEEKEPNQENTPDLSEPLSNAAQELIGTFENQVKEEEQQPKDEINNENQSKDEDENTTNQEDPSVLQDVINDATQGLLGTNETQNNEEEPQSKNENDILTQDKEENEDSTNREDAADIPEPLTDATQNLIGAFDNLVKGDEEQPKEEDEEQPKEENEDQEKEEGISDKNQDDTPILQGMLNDTTQGLMGGMETENKENEQKDENKSETNDNESPEPLLKTVNSLTDALIGNTENPEDNNKNEQEDTENTVEDTEEQNSPVEVHEDEKENDLEEKNIEPVNQEEPAVEEEESQESEAKVEEQTTEENPNDTNTIQEVAENIQNVLFGQTPEIKEINDVLEVGEAKEYTYDTEIVSIPDEFDIHQPYLLNHAVKIQILPNQTEPIQCLFSATTDINVFDNYCKYLKLNNVATYHFSSQPNEDNTDNYFSFCTGHELVTLINPTEDQIKSSFKSFKECYIIPCSLEDKEQLKTYENIPSIERMATDTMINYINNQINEQKVSLQSELFEYENPLTYSSFLNTSIDSYLAYLSSYQNDECERILDPEHEYTHNHEKCSLFDKNFNTNHLLGINNVCEIELSPSNFVRCVFSKTEDIVLERYLSLLHFKKSFSYHFSSSPNGRVNYFSFCTGEDLITLINPTQSQLNIVFKKTKNLYAIPCGLNDKSQLFFYDFLNKIQKVSSDRDVQLISEEIKSIQSSSYSRNFSYDISSSYEKFLFISYSTFLGYLVRSQFIEPVCPPSDIQSYNVHDFITLRKLDYGKTLALNWSEGKVYILKKFRDDFKFNQSMYLYKNKRMSRLVPFFGAARNDDKYLVFGIGSRGTLKEVASCEHMSIKTCKKVTIQLVFALAYLHMTETKPCSISANHVSLDWSYNAFLTDIDDSERVVNVTPENLDIINLSNVLYTLVTGESISSSTSKSIPSIYGPVARIFELCKKPETTACDLVSVILSDKEFSEEEELIERLLKELPQKVEFNKIEAFDDIAYKYFKVNCRDAPESTINFIKTLKFGPVTTFQFIEDEDSRILIFETNHICGLLKNVSPKVVNIVISKMKDSNVAAVSQEDLDILFEYFKFDLIQNFYRDPQLDVYRSNAKQVHEDMNDFKDKFIVGDALSLSIVISHPSKVKAVIEESSTPSTPQQFPQVSFVGREFNMKTEMKPNQPKKIEILDDYVLTCLYSTDEDYTFNEFVKDFKKDKLAVVHFSRDENTNAEFVTFCANNMTLLLQTKDNESQVNKVINQIKTIKVYGVSPDDRSRLFSYTNFDLIQSFASQNEMNDLLNKVESLNDEILPKNLTFDNGPMTYSSFFKHAEYAIEGYYFLINPDSEQTIASISASFEPSLNFGTSFEKVLDSSFKPKQPKTFSIAEEETDWKKALELYTLAAERNDPAALFNLGLMYSTGQGVEKDKQKAVEYYKRSAELGNTKAQFNLGLMYYKGEGCAEDKAEAARWYQKAADNGNAKAQSNLGFMYSRGDGVEKDYAKAIELYEKAVAQNDPDAQLNLGIMIEQGQGTPVDKERVVDLYTKSAENGNAKAQFNLAVLYHNGIKGVLQKDNKKAVSLYSQAASQGLTKAQFNLGVLYANGDEGIPVDKKRAVQLLQLAADKGDEDAQLNLGAMYAKGEGVPEVDKKKTLELYTKAADQGNSKAQFNLAVMYAKGDGVEKDYVKAAEFYQKAADQDIAQAAFNLGVLYFRGVQGLPSDKKKAAELFEKTAELCPTNSKAIYNLAVMYTKGEGVEKDEVKGRQLFERAAALNNKEALLNLGLMYIEGGGGLRRDKTKAFECYKRSADLGNDKAQLNVGLLYQKGEGCDIDKESARKYFQLAANQGNAQAQINLGLILLGGGEDEQSKAKQYLNDAAKEGNVDAMVGLAKRYQIDDETESAIKWYSRASDQGNSQAMLELGKIYLNGDGVEMDLEKAENYLNKAVSNKSDDALLYLGDLFEKKGMNEKATEMYNRSIEAGVEGANERLNRMNMDSTSEPFKEKNLEEQKNDEAEAANEEVNEKDTVNEEDVNNSENKVIDDKDAVNDENQDLIAEEPVVHNEEAPTIDTVNEEDVNNGENEAIDDKAAVNDENQDLIAEEPVVQNEEAPAEEQKEAGVIDTVNEEDVNNGENEVINDKAAVNDEEQDLIAEEPVVHNEEAPAEEVHEKDISAVDEEDVSNGEHQVMNSTENNQAAINDEEQDLIAEEPVVQNEEAKTLNEQSQEENENDDQVFSLQPENNSDEEQQNQNEDEGQTFSLQPESNSNKEQQNQDEDDGQAFSLQVENDDDSNKEQQKSEEDKQVFSLQVENDQQQKEEEEENDGQFFSLQPGNDDSNQEQQQQRTPKATKDGQFFSLQPNNDDDSNQEQEQQQKSEEENDDQVFSLKPENDSNQEQEQQQKPEEENDDQVFSLKPEDDSNQEQEQQKPEEENDDQVFSLQVENDDEEDETESKPSVKSRNVTQHGASAANDSLSFDDLHNLFNSLESHIQVLQQVSPDPYVDSNTTLVNVDNYFINRSLNDCLRTYMKSNKKLRIAEDEVETFMSDIQPSSMSNGSNLPSLNVGSPSKANKGFKMLNLSSDNGEDAIKEDEEELERLKSDVQTLEAQLNQVNQQIKNTLRSIKNSIASSSPSPTSTHKKKVTQPSESNFSVSPRSSNNLSPRSARNKIKILQKRVKTGDANAQYLLGACYALGQGVAQDKEKAFEYYQMAAEQGNVNAQFALASCYSYGKGTEVDKRKAFEFYLMAAEQGHEKSQFAVGHFYDFGQGVVEQDHEVAVEWYKKAAAQGHQSAIEMLRNESDSSNE